MSVPVEPLSLAGEAARRAGAEAGLAGILAERARTIAEARLDVGLLWAAGKLALGLAGEVALEALRSPALREAARRWALEAIAGALGVATEGVAPEERRP